jgi:hypothetical protein
MHTDDIQTVFDMLTEVRESGINKIVREENCDRFAATVKWDTHLAPLVTDREKFALIGIHLPADFVPQTDAEAMSFNDRVFAAYKMWGDEVIAYDHLSPTDLTRVLQMVLDDKVHLVPPTRDCTQYIDLAFSK